MTEADCDDIAVVDDEIRFSGAAADMLRELADLMGVTPHQALGEALQALRSRMAAKRTEG